MEDRMKIMEQLSNRKYTHTCPECNSGSYCAMEAGKSFSLCWCMTEKAKNESVYTGNVCLCKKCLV